MTFFMVHHRLSGGSHLHPPIFYSVKVCLITCHATDTLSTRGQNHRHPAFCIGQNSDALLSIYVHLELLFHLLRWEKDDCETPGRGEKGKNSWSTPAFRLEYQDDRPRRRGITRPPNHT